MIRVPRLVVAGTGSGVGKTTATVALAGALRARGLAVAAFKCGPDYLDPTWAARATGRPCHALDGWMMGEPGVRRTFGLGSAGADVALIEGMMGLFDGASATSDEGSSAQVARFLDAPVLLVVDAAGMARSVAAIAAGYARFDPRVRVAGVLANRVGSRGHLELLAEASAEFPVLGGLPAGAGPEFPGRHLGLFAADTGSDEAIEAWAGVARDWIDLERILEIAGSAGALPDPPIEPACPAPVACRIGVARDEALHFYYPENLARLEALGAEIVRFRLLDATRIPEVDGLYLGGGYPEEHAERLAASRSMLESIRAFEGPIYAECGGLMVLVRRLVTAGGASHEMAGLLPATCRMSPGLAALGYAEVRTTAASFLGPAGTRFRGHQFRHGEIEVEGPLERVYSVSTRPGAPPFAEGYRSGNVLASYVHAHWASNPAVPEAFVAAASARR